MSSRGPRCRKSKPTSALALAYRKALLALSKVLVVAVVTHPAIRLTVDCRWGEVCVAGHCKAPSNPLKAVLSFSVTGVSWFSLDLGIVMGFYFLK